MKILFDTSILFQQEMGGISRVAAAIYQALSLRHEVTLTRDPRDSCNAFRHKFAGASVLNSSRWHARLPFGFVTPAGFDLVLIPYLNFSFSASVPVVAILHDVIREQIFPFRSRVSHSIAKWLTLFFADAVVCISATTRDALFAVWPRFAYKSKSVLYLGCDDLGGTSGAAERRKPRHLLFVGRRDSYKRFDLCVAALRAIKDAELVVVGKAFSSEELSQYSDVVGRIEVLEGIADADLQALYQQCSCLLFPSTSEGFGLPALEAVAYGLRVIMLDVAFAREIQSFLGDGVILAAEEDFVDAVSSSLTASGAFLPPGALPSWTEWVLGFERLVLRLKHDELR